MTQVLIIGAGPTGLFLSYLLKRRGIDIRLIDKGSGPSIHSKATGIHSRTLEILDKEGLIEDFLAAGYHLNGLLIHSKGREVKIEIDDTGDRYPFILGLPQPETEGILINALKKLGVKVEWNQEITGYDGNKPILNGQPLEIPWIIACEGAHSITRKSHPYSFLGKPLHEAVLLADVEADCPYPIDYIQPIFNGAHCSLLFPLPNNRFRVLFMHDESCTYTEEDLPTLCKQYGYSSAFKINKILWFTNFKLSARVVNTFRYGNIFVLGDAAHVHSPMLGQGMNTCFQDAYNLAWKLELVIKGDAHETLLDSFSEERIPVVESMLRKTTLVTKLLTKQRVPLNFISKLANMISHFTSLRKKIVRNMMMLTIGYKNSSITFELDEDKQWKAPALGFPAPNAKLQDGSFLLDHLHGTKHMLIHFNPHSAIRPTDFYDVLHLSGKDAKESYGARTESFFLIRPDGHIGYRTSNGSIKGLKDYLDRLHYCENRKRVVLNV